MGLVSEKGVMVLEVNQVRMQVLCWLKNDCLQSFNHIHHMQHHNPGSRLLAIQFAGVNATKVIATHLREKLAKFI